MKRLICLMLIMLLFGQSICSAEMVLSSDENLKSLGKTSRAKQVIANSSIRWEAGRLLNKERYDEAYAKYEEALQPKYITKPRDRNGALIGMTIVRLLQGRYQEAYNLNEELIANNPTISSSDYDPWGLRRRELAALINFQEKKIPDDIRSYIAYRKQYEARFSPFGQFDFREINAFRENIYLYEIIQDYDAALKLCDEYLAMKKVKKDKKFKAEVEDLRKTILEAKQTKQKGIIFKKLNQYGFYNWL